MRNRSTTRCETAVPQDACGSTAPNLDVSQQRTMSKPRSQGAKSAAASGVGARRAESAFDLQNCAKRKNSRYFWSLSAATVSRSGMFEEARRTAEWRRARMATTRLSHASGRDQSRSSSASINGGVDSFPGELISGNGDLACAVEEIVAQNYSCILAHVDKDSTAANSRTSG